MKKMTALLLSMLMLIGALSGCAQKTEPNNAATGDRETVVLAESGEWWGEDVTQLDGSQFTQGLVGDPLVVLDEDGNMQPCIASQVIVSEDGKKITLTIPEGMKFASGEQVEPEDVVASLERFKKVSPFTTNLDSLESMEIEGRDVILQLSEFTSDMAVSLSGAFITVQDKDVLDVSTDDELLWGAQPYGMYYLEDYVAGSHVVLTKNPGYITHNPYVENKGAALVDTVTVRFISEEFSMANAMNVNDIQVILDISSNGLSQITREDIETLQTISNPNIDYLEFNLASEKLADPLVREALAIAVNRETLQHINADLVIPAYSIVTDKVINHSEEFAQYYKMNYDTDVERAKELLKQAGWTDTDGNGYLDKGGQELSLKIVGNDGAVENNTVQSLQIQYKEIGVNLQIEMFTNYYHYDAIAAGNYDIGLEHFGWQEPILLLNMLLTDPQNLVTCGEEATFYDLIAKASHTQDADERTQLVYDAEKVLSDHMITVPLYTAQANFVFADGIQGIDVRGNGAIFFNDMQ